MGENITCKNISGVWLEKSSQMIKYQNHSPERKESGIFMFCIIDLQVLVVSAIQKEKSDLTIDND